MSKNENKLIISVDFLVGLDGIFTGGHVGQIKKIKNGHLSDIVYLHIGAS